MKRSVTISSKEMKSTRRFTTIALALVAVFLCGAFTACNGTATPPLTTADVTTAAPVTTTASPEPEPEPEPLKLTIDGVSITEYKIVYGTDDGKVAAEFMRDEIFKASGETVGLLEATLTEDNASRNEYEILVGRTARAKAPDCPEYYSYKTVALNTNVIKLGGYDSYALNNAAYAFVRALVEADGKARSSDLNITYTLPDREEYIEDIDKLYMRWIAEWQPDPRMLDYEAKLDSFRNVSDRLLTCLHRGDGLFYPENSIEGIISSYKMGVDCVELDIQETKDGILILLHDYDLFRMTNADEFVGKTLYGIRFPDSYSVKDWTYEQIKYLNLRDKWGYVNNGWDGPRHPVTPFKIPTLAEALKVCKNRLFIIPDKTDVWSYVFNGSGKPELYRYMKATDNYESIIISYGVDAVRGAEIQEYIYNKSGVAPLMLIRDDNANAATFEYLSGKTPEKSFGIQVGGNFYIPPIDAVLTPTFKEWSQKIVLWGWTIENNEKYAIWNAMYNVGYRMIMGNMQIDFIKFAADVSGFN